MALSATMKREAFGDWLHTVPQPRSQTQRALSSSVLLVMSRSRGTEIKTVTIRDKTKEEGERLGEARRTCLHHRDDLSSRTANWSIFSRPFTEKVRSHCVCMKPQQI